MATTPTVVLIHGGWHVPANYAQLTACLRAAGLEVHCPALPSMNGTRPPNADLADDTALIRGYVESLVSAGRTVTAVMHSYGGQVGSNALVGLDKASRVQQGEPGGVNRLVYLCAFALIEGQSMISKVVESGHEHLVPLAFDFADDDSCINRDPKTLLLGAGLLNDDEADAYVAKLVRWNGRSMYQPIERCAWREIPVTYVLTSQDMTVPLDYQRSMVEMMAKAGVKVDTVELDTWHCPHATMTAGVAAAIEKAVAGG